MDKLNVMDGKSYVLCENLWRNVIMFGGFSCYVYSIMLDVDRAKYAQDLQKIMAHLIED